jgi:transcriptional regulator with XRE-family HTH domain
MSTRILVVDDNPRIKKLADWIQVKRQEKNFTPGHLAAKMGIASALVSSWEDGTAQPDKRQLEILANVLGFDAGFDPTKEDVLFIRFPAAQTSTTLIHRRQVWQRSS